MLKKSNQAIRRYVLSKAILQFKLKSKNKSKHKLTLFSNANSIGILLNFIAFLFQRTLKIHLLKTAFTNFQKNLESKQSYFLKLKEAFKLELNTFGHSLEKINSKGPVIFYANHPFSGMDAFALAAEIERFRPDIKVLAASYLQHFPGFKAKSFIINVQDKVKFKAQNKKVYSAVNDHIRQGKALLIFPAGDVSELSKNNSLYAMDPPWLEGFIRFGMQSVHTKFIPIFIQGEPSKRYLNLRLKAKTLSNFYVLHEFANRINRKMNFIAGKSIPLNDLEGLDIQEKIMYLRAKLYGLGSSYYKSLNGNKLIEEHCPKFPLLKQMESSLLQAVDAALLKRELAPIYSKYKGNTQRYNQ